MDLAQLTLDSIGDAVIATDVYPVDGTDAETLLKNADVALIRARSNGRCNYQFFTSDHTAAATNERSNGG